VQHEGEVLGCPDSWHGMDTVVTAEHVPGATESPTEILRAAAKLLRERAASLTDTTPWEPMFDEFSDSWQLGCEPPEYRLASTGASVSVGKWHVASDMTPAVAVWCATVHPALAEPLAAWLEHQAEVRESVGGDSSVETNHALAVARVILDGAP